MEKAYRCLDSQYCARRITRRIIILVIQAFRSAATEELFVTKRHRRFASIASIAVRKLQMLEEAEVLADLREPPGNRLEALRGDREGQHSIRVNDQFRICFTWKEDGAYDVEIIDYH